MTASDRTNQERASAGTGVAVVHLLLALALLRGLGFDPPVPADDPPNLIELPPQAVPPPQPPPPPSTGAGAADRRADPRPEGAASPPNLESRATPVVAPPPILPPIVPPPLPAAPRAGLGSDPSAGAAKVAGPGTGSGGIGDGTGSGGDGDGGGGGGDYGDGGGLSPPRWLRGRLRNSDYPPGLGEAGVGGTVSVRYTVETDGSVTGCTVTRSSGSATLDRTTCRLIEQRFRFDPSRDGAGRPIRSRIVENHEWVVEDLPDDPAPPRRRRLW